MKWLGNNFEKRLNPSELEPGTKTVISLLVNYYPESYQDGCGISRYALGKDYHKVLRKKGKLLIRWMEEEIGSIQARVFVDSAPVMEREWAQRAGLGWQGKNGCFIRNMEGSWFFLVEIFTDLELEHEQVEVKNRCGSCTKCIDACPTQALLGDGLLDARKCISYLTIELGGQIPQGFHGQWDDWIFGCDICQEVCPWNKTPDFTAIDAFKPQQQILNLKNLLTEQCEEEELSALIQGTALKRTGVEGLRRNQEIFKL
jgi:epoxyqueuosine reductase